jgi:hypothetical protein
MALVNGNAAAEIGARPGMEALVTAQ